MTTPSEALAVALNGLNRAIDEMWNDEARRVALPERHVKEITRWQAIAQAALRSAPVPSVATLQRLIATSFDAPTPEVWREALVAAKTVRNHIEGTTPAETAPHPAGGDGIVERLTGWHPTERGLMRRHPRGSWTGRDDAEKTVARKDAEIERLQAQVAGLSDPTAVHLNMLRGGIAKPSWANIKHLYPEEFAAEVATVRREAFEEATEWHKAEISRLERQIEDNNEYGRRTGQDFTRSAANEHCRSRINAHQWSIDDLLRRRDRALKENDR